MLARELDDRYAFLRNYTPPPPHHQGGDIDAVLIGPRGVTIFEIKAWRGLYRNEGTDWWYSPNAGRDWEPALGNPTAQALANADRIRALLRAAGLHQVPVRPMVAVADDKMRVELGAHPAVFVFRACAPGASFRSVLTGAPSSRGHLPPEVLQRVYAALVLPLYAGRPAAR